MNDIKETIQLIKYCADYADYIGDYKTADKAYELLKEAENFSDNVRLASTREAKFNLGKGWRSFERGVRKTVPGGWAGLGLMAAGGGLFGSGAKNFLTKGLGSLTKGLGGKLPVNFGDAMKKYLASGGNIGSVLGLDPTLSAGLQQALAGGQAGDMTGQQGMPGQPGFSPYAGFQTANVPQPQLDAQLNYYVNTLYNTLNNIRDPKQRQNELNKIKANLPLEVNRNFPQLSAYVPYLIQDTVNKLNSQYPTTKLV
jgi:hypothetical protein